ncbi:MAG: hypothetical protein M0Z59_08600 [Nitrospiraceae bacterium]|nr:hypothetical protein [Nitrospiraceae bacterium]
MRNRTNLLMAFFALLTGLTVALGACGGGGGGGTPSPGPTPGTQATMTGQVLGTTFVAVDASTNTIVGSAAATGSPGTFSMQVPIGKNYKFYLLENEGTPSQRLYPLYVQNQNQSRNVFSVGQARTINLGFMNTIPGFAVSALGLQQMQALGMNAVSFDSTVPGTYTGTAFSNTLLDGAWNMHGLADNGHWFHQKMTVSSGSAAFANFTSSGAVGNRATMTMNMMPGGVMNSPDSADFNAFMGHLHELLVGTDVVSGQNQMFIAEKAPTPGTAFAIGNMTGTWQTQGIINGPNYNGWMQGPVVIDGSGNITPSSNLHRNDGTAFTITGPAVVDASSGTVTMAGVPSFHGTMNQGKDRIIATMTDASGNSALVVMQKSTATNHSNADFAGTWYMHNLGVGAADRNDFGPAHFDSSGNGMMQRSSTSPGFINATPFSFQMRMDNTGMMSSVGGFSGMMPGGMMGGNMPGSPGGGGMPGGGMMPGPGGSPVAGFSGFMSDGNDLLIVNLSQTVGGVQKDQDQNLMILQK